MIRLMKFKADQHPTLEVNPFQRSRFSILICIKISYPRQCLFECRPHISALRYHIDLILDLVILIELLAFRYFPTAITVISTIFLF